MPPWRRVGRGNGWWDKGGREQGQGQGGGKEKEPEGEGTREREETDEGEEEADGEEESTVYVFKASDTIVEAKLTNEQRRMFDKAKDEALEPWISNSAWKRIKKDNTQSHETVPLRFLLRWKPDKKAPAGRKANARVILQGYKHQDAVTKKLV